MSQASPLIGSNKSGLTYRQEDNDGKQALLNHHKGATAPSYAEAGAVWLDDAATPWVLKIYDGVDWINLSQVNASTNTVLPYAGQDVMRGLPLCTDSGSVNAYGVTLTPAISSYTAGLTILLSAGSANTGASTLAVDGLTAADIIMPDGMPTLAGAMLSGGIYLLCYDGTAFKLMNPSQAQTQAILQTAMATHSGHALLSVAIPSDDTIPTSSEGTEIMSISITPKRANSRILIRVTGFISATSAPATITAALFVHGSSSAFGVMPIHADPVSALNNLSMMMDHTPGSTSPITYKLRVGSSAASARPNGINTARQYGGVGRWVMTVEEYSQ